MGAERDRLPALAARAQLGDRVALESLLRIVQPALAAHLRILMQDDDAADDVLQDSLLLIARRLGTLREVEWVRAWSYRIATREARRLLRRSRRWRNEQLDAAETVPEPEMPDEPGEAIRVRLLERLPLLPPKAQVVVRLRFVESLSQQEIAEALEIPLGTVKSRLAYGLQCLRESLSGLVPMDSSATNNAGTGQGRQP